MSKLTQISNKYKKEADKLIIKTNLAHDLKKYGEVHFAGAYSANLMMHGDVDITVVKNRSYSISEVFKIFKTLYYGGKFRSYFIKGDWEDPRMGDEFPNGYYVGLKAKVNGEKWKFDIWFVSKKEFEERNKSFSIDRFNLTNKQRELILTFKKYRKDNKLSISGQTIYKAVLEGSCKTTRDLNKYLNKK